MKSRSKSQFGDDSELAERLRAREPEAMADLYDRYGHLAYALIFRIVRNPGVAEDLVQETFLRIWNQVRAFDVRKGALGSWLLTVARNRAIDHLRSMDGRMSHRAFEFVEIKHPSVFADFDRDVLNIERVERLRDAFTKLSQNQRDVIEMAYYEGLTQSEMAERMNQPLGTVKTWVRSALKVLRGELGVTATP